MFDPHRRTMELLPLACLCLVSCSAMTSADGNGPVVITVDEDSVAMLPCSLSTKENIESKLFDWKKVGEKGEGKKDVFMYDAGSLRDSARSGQDQQFDGRVSHFRDELKHGNASILITKTKVADSGDYTCDFLEPSQSLQPIQTSHIKLIVGAAPEPSVTNLDQTKDWALLQCVVKGASPKPKVEWKDSAGNILPADDLQDPERGGKFYVTVNITVTKTDRYSCVSTQEEIHHQTHAETFVLMNGAAPEPFIKILDQTEHGVLLHCFVRGASPKPKVQWQDSQGTIIPAEEPQVTERGGSYDVILQATVTKSGNFRCVSTQEEINHQIYAETFVPFNEESSSKMIIGIVVGTIIGIIIGVGIVLGVLKARSGYSKTPSDSTKGTTSERLNDAGNSPA